MFTSGSSAEFYITPVLAHIGDIDVMLCHHSCLTIPEGHAPPAQLPSHYHRNVVVYEIIDSHQPGCVYLNSSYVLEKDEDDFYVVESRESGEPLLLFLHSASI